MTELIKFKNYENFGFFYIGGTLLGSTCTFFARLYIDKAIILLTLAVSVLILEIIIAFKMNQPIKVYQEGLKTGFYTLKSQEIMSYEWLDNDKIYAELIFHANQRLFNLYSVNRKIRMYVSKEKVNEIDKALSLIIQK